MPDHNMNRLASIIAEIVTTLGIDVGDCNLGPGPDICALGDEAVATLKSRTGNTPSGRAEELITQLEAEVVKRDARIAELEAELETTLVDWGTLRLELAALKAQQPSAGVVLPEPDFYWISGDEGSWNSPEEWAQDYYDNSGEKPESVLLSCAAELPDREYDSFEFDADGSCTSCRLVNPEFARLNPCRAQAVPDGLCASAENCAFVMRYIGSMEPDEIDGDNVELRFEDEDGRDTGADASIVEYAGKVADLLDAMLAAAPSAKPEKD